MRERPGVADHIASPPLAGPSSTPTVEVSDEVHRSAIVNVSAIESVGHDVTGHLIVRLKGRDETLRVSQPYAYRFRQM